MQSKRLIACVLLLIIAAIPGFSQVATGAPPFSSVANGGADAVNLANLNVHISIPVFARQGRGLSFHYALSFDNSVWYPVTSGSTAQWQPVSNWGWRGETHSDVLPMRQRQ